MKVFALFIALLVVEYSCGTVDVNLSIAFENVTRHLFELETRMFIDNYDVDLNELTALVLKGLNERAMPFQLSNKKLDNKVQMNSSALVTFKSFDQLRKFNDKLGLTNKYYKPLQLFLFCQDASVKEIELLAEDVYQRHTNSQRTYYQTANGYPSDPEEVNDAKKILNENTALTDVVNYQYFLVREGSFFRLLTFVWYSPGKCGELQLIEVNKFSKETKKWENNKFITEKLTNFHGCEIIHQWVAMSYDSLFHWWIPLEIAASLNFKTKYYTDGDRVDFYLHKACYDNHNYMINFDNIVDPASDEKSTTTVDCFITFPVQYKSTFMAVPASENYSEFEKLSMPFDDFTWALIAFIFVAAFLTILILYYMPTTTRDLVIGVNITTPSLNILQIFFGIGMIELPHRNFARFLTMSFILYCLIIRTAWQGKMFEFMTKNVSKPEIQTVEEMIQNRFVFYMEADFKKKHPESEIAQRGNVSSNLESLNWSPGSSTKNKTWESLFDSGFQGAMQVSADDLEYYIRKSKGRFVKRVRKDIITSKMCGMAFMSHHHYTGIFDFKSQQLFTAGIAFFHLGTNFQWQSLLENCKMKYKIPPDEPQELNLEKLEPGFLIISSCLLFAFFVFLLELLSTLCRYLLPTFKSKRQFRVANLALNTAKVAISVIPGLGHIEIEGQKYFSIDCDENVEVAIECEKVIKLTDKQETSKGAGFALNEVDVEANERSLKSFYRRSSIDDLIEAFETQIETAKQTRDIILNTHAISRKDSIDELLQGFEFQTESTHQTKNRAENQEGSIDNAIDDLLELVRSKQNQ